MAKKKESKTEEEPRRKIVLLKIQEVQKRTTLSRSSIYSKMTKGTFPQVLKLGGTAAAWVESEVDDWINERIQERQERQDTNA